MNATNGDYLHLYKRYVDVVTVIKKNGQMLPLYLAWMMKMEESFIKSIKCIKSRKL